MRPILFTIASLFLISSIASSQSISISMTVESMVQGKFMAESMRAKAVEKANKIDVVSVASELTSPRDIASGLATGKRQHKPLTIVKQSGASSPQFFRAAISNENLKKVVIEFYKADGRTGQEALFYTITLEDASVANFRQYSTDTNLFDEIKLTFRKITVESATGKTAATDDWMAQ